MNANVWLYFTDDPRLCYSIREQICVGVWPNPKGKEINILKGLKFDSN